MSRSFPLAEFSVLAKAYLAKPRLSLQFSASDGGFTGMTRHSSPVCLPAISPSLGSRHPRRSGAFTLIEMLIVIAIIVILAGIAVGILGAVNRGSAESRARGEVAAIVGALEDFRLAYGGQLPPVVTYGTNKTIDAKELVGQANAAINQSRTVFLEPSEANYTNGVLQDPWGNAYVYETNASGYDIYSFGDGRSTNSYIRP